MSKTINVMVKEPGKAPYMAELENTLAACMAQAAEEVMEAICEGYCKYPFIMDELELEEQCADCGLAAQLAALGA